MRKGRPSNQKSFFFTENNKKRKLWDKLFKKKQKKNKLWRKISLNNRMVPKNQKGESLSSQKAVYYLETSNNPNGPP